MKKIPTGFTLVETLVAIAIVSISIAGPLLAAERSYVAAITARDQLTASYLAQEAIEDVRAARDNLYLTEYQAGDQDATKVAWQNFLAALNTAGCRAATKPACSYDPLAGLAACANGVCAPLTLDSTKNLYVQTWPIGTDTGTATTFSRTVTASDVAGTSGLEELITVKMSWQSAHQVYTLTVDDHLTQWE